MQFIFIIDEGREICVTIFSNKWESFPSINRIGDIMILNRATCKMWKNELQINASIYSNKSDSSSFAVFKGHQEPNDDFESVKPIFNDYVPFAFSKLRNFTDHEHQLIE